MIDDLDTTLRRLFRNRVPLLTSDLQVRFEPPNAAWRDYVAGLSDNGDPVLALNVYLAELRENRKLRSPDVDRLRVNGTVIDRPPPSRVDCHYLVSAWDSASAGEAIQPTPDEHALLYAALAALYGAAPLNPSRILTGAELAAVDELIRTSDLATEIVPPTGFGKLAEFWSGMGPTIPWRPVVHLVVTVPVAEPALPPAPIVTTLIAEHRLDDGDVAETWTHIGGRVMDGGRPVVAAWVRLESPSGDLLDTARTNAEGRFAFGAVGPGAYRLRWRSAARPDPDPRDVVVPSPTGEYDLRIP